MASEHSLNLQNIIFELISLTFSEYGKFGNLQVIIVQFTKIMECRNVKVKGCSG